MNSCDAQQLKWKHTMEMTVGREGVSPNWSVMLIAVDIKEIKNSMRGRVVRTVTSTLLCILCVREAELHEDHLVRQGQCGNGNGKPS